MTSFILTTMSLSFTAAQLLPLHQINQFDQVTSTKMNLAGFPFECSKLNLTFAKTELKIELKIDFVEFSKCVKLNAQVHPNRTVLLHQSTAAVAGKCLCEEECTAKVTKSTQLNEIECKTYPGLSIMCYALRYCSV